MYKTKYLVYLLLFSLTVGCKKGIQTGPVQTIDPIVKFTADTFNDLYLWYETIPVIDLTAVKTPADYVSKVKNAKDKWSFTMSYTDMVNLLQNGVTTGWGIGLGFDSQSKLRVLYVYDNSAMGKAGVKRGWQLKSINSKLVSTMAVSEINTTLSNSSNSFTLIKNDGSETSLQLARGPIGINSVLYSSVYTVGGKKIGYLVFNEFLGSSIKELNTVFNDFSTTGITDLILDLRYNGGGTLDCADSLVAMVAGKPFKDKLYNTLIYTNKHTNFGFSSNIKIKGNSVQLNKLTIITTASTASARELVISGLKPYMNMKLIGSVTQGKPVGMNIASDTKLNIAVAPISFRNVNSQGYTDYFDGIPVDFAVKDNVAQDWGDASDQCLTAALNYISTGTIGFIPTVKSVISSDRIIYKGIDTPVENLFHDPSAPYLKQN